jgi:hypothetical protein
LEKRREKKKMNLKMLKGTSRMKSAVATADAIPDLLEADYLSKDENKDENSGFLVSDG